MKVLAASDMELKYLAHLWDHAPGNSHVCPNCLAYRRGKETDTPHASWCAIKREVDCLEMKEKGDKVWIVNFKTENDDHFSACFKEKPTDRHLTAYCVEHYPKYFSFKDNSDFSKGGERWIYWEVVECDLLGLPLPIDVIPSI
jgi:hypothetical protein